MRKAYDKPRLAVVCMRTVGMLADSAHVNIRTGQSIDDEDNLL